MFSYSLRSSASRRMATLRSSVSIPTFSPQTQGLASQYNAYTLFPGRCCACFTTKSSSSTLSQTLLDPSSHHFSALQEQQYRPSLDLILALSARAPYLDTDTPKILDIGCGAGTITKFLRYQFPNASIDGVETSHTLIRQAQTDLEELPNSDTINFSFCQDLEEFVTQLYGESNRGNNQANQKKYDIIISSGALHRIQNHRSWIPRVLTLLEPGGVFAFQFEDRCRMPVYASLIEQAHTSIEQPLSSSSSSSSSSSLSSSSSSSSFSSSLLAKAIDGVDLHVDVGTFYDIFSECSALTLESEGKHCIESIDLWSPTYHMFLQGSNPVYGLIRGQGSLDRLLQSYQQDNNSSNNNNHNNNNNNNNNNNDIEKNSGATEGSTQEVENGVVARFLDAYAQACLDEYSARQDGTTLFPVPRFFGVVKKAYLHDNDDYRLKVDRLLSQQDEKNESLISQLRDTADALAGLSSSTSSSSTLSSSSSGPPVIFTRPSSNPDKEDHYENSVAHYEESLENMKPEDLEHLVKQKAQILHDLRVPSKRLETLLMVVPDLIKIIERRGGTREELEEVLSQHGDEIFGKEGFKGQKRQPMIRSLPQTRKRRKSIFARGPNGRTRRLPVSDSPLVDKQTSGAPLPPGDPRVRRNQIKRILQDVSDHAQNPQLEESEDSRRRNRKRSKSIGWADLKRTGKIGR